jgi:Zn-finger protein
MMKRRGQFKTCPNDMRPASCWGGVWLCFSCHVAHQDEKAKAFEKEQNSVKIVVKTVQLVDAT